MKESYARYAPSAIAALSTLLLVDLFLDWRHVSVGMMGVVQVNVAAIGWTGWGWATGLSALALLIYALLEVAGYIRQETGTEIAPAVLAIVACLSSLAAFHDVTAVNVSVTAVDVSREWPAYVGVVLATALALVAVARLLVSGPAFSGRSHPAH